MIRRVSVKTCCSNKVDYFELDKPLRKVHAQYFKQHGYIVPEHFYTAGIFYAMKDKVTMNGSFGSNRFTVRCSNSENCEEKLKQLENDIEEALKS